MLRVRLVSQRVACQPWTAWHTCQRRLASDWSEFSGDSSGRPPRKPGQRREWKVHGGGSREGVAARSGRNGVVAPAGRGYGAAEGEGGDTEPRMPSLVEQLFPEETKRYTATRKKSREIPRLPLDTFATPQAPPQPVAPPPSRGPAPPSGTALLVLRDASPNLTEDDFRRLIPQGKHIEGWTVEQGDILKVIQCRNMSDLSPYCNYYLLFSSTLSALAYRSHVHNIHILASQHTPSSITSAIPPPPGLEIQGLDVHAAIEAYALVPPGESLNFSLHRPPLPPEMMQIVQHRGYPLLVQRENKMPFEARITLEGPQISLSAVHYEIIDSGKKRGLSWSGGENHTMQFSRWDYEQMKSDLRDSRAAGSEVTEPSGEEEREPAKHQIDQQSKDNSDKLQQKRRTPRQVYIVGFETERAAQSFVQYWHRRPIGSSRHPDIEGDLPPIANVDLLW